MRYNISSGVVRSGIELNSSDFMYVYIDGTANATTVNFGGGLIVNSGGMASATTLNSGGSMHVFSGGIANATAVNSGGSMHINGGMASATTLNSGGSMHVFSGIANATTVNSLGWLYVSRGGTASATTVNSIGQLIVDSGGTVSATTVNFGGRLYVSRGGMASVTTVNFGGSMTVSYDGMASATTMNARGLMTVYNSGMASATTINSGGSLVVSDGGMANATTVNSGGSIHIFNGGTASIVFNPWQGMVLSATGATVTYLERDANVYWGNDVFGIIGKADVAENIVISSGVSMHVYSGGITRATIVNTNGSIMVSNGGKASAATVYAAGLMTVYNSGMASATTVNSGGSLAASNGGMANETTVNSGGSMTVYSGGMANTTTLNSGGSMMVSNGGTASFAFNPWQGAVSSAAGATITYLERDANVYWGNGVSGIIGKADVVESIVISSGVSMHVFNGGTASGTTVNAYGFMYVSSGGSAVGILLNSNGFLDIRSANVNSATVSRGGSCAIAGGTVNHLTLMSRGSAVVSNTEINGVEVFSSGRLDCVSYLEGKMAVSGAIVHSDGQITMSSGALISATTVSKAGTLNLENGGSSYQTHIYEEGKFTMLGVANHTVLNGGSMYIGDSAYRYYDGTGGVPTSNVYDEDIHASVNILNSSWMHVYSGGTATSNTISSNSWAHVYYGGTATSNVINSSGYLTLQDSGTADTTVLHSGGYMRLYTGAILKGETCVGGKVTVENAGTSATEDVIRAYGAKINYLVSERTTADESIITDLGMIMGATYFVTVSDIQLSGIYRLADGAKDFTGSIMVKNTANQELGVLSVGQTLQMNGVGYSLNLTGNQLIFTVSGGVSDTEPPTITQITANTTAATNQNVTVTANFADNVALASKQYRLGSGNWLDYAGEITVTANTTVYFRAVDTAGNEANEQYVVSNIDKVAPTITQVKVNTTAATNQDVTVTATFADNVALALKQYKIGDGSWQNYTNGITMTANGTVYFRAIDTAGNEATAQYVVSNIDKTAPTITGIVANTTAPTAQDVTVTANFADNVALASKQYRLGSGDWLTYTGVITVTANTTVYFKAVDTAGNEANAQYVVSNINKIVPMITDIAANTTNPTNQNVTVTANFADNVTLVSKQYKIGNGGWTNYIGAVTMTANGTVYFRAIDTAGNEATAQYAVVNIDKVAPTITQVKANTTVPTNQNVAVTAVFADNVALKSQQYKIGNGSWQNYTGAVTMTTNGTVYFKAVDTAGNEVSAQYAVANIDKNAPTIAGIAASKTTATNQDVMVTATFGDNVDLASKQYWLGSGNWLDYTGAITVTANTTVYFKAVDTAGNEANEQYVVSNIDKVAPTITQVKADTTAATNQNVTVTVNFADDVALKSQQYKIGGGSWQNYTDGVTMTANGTVYFKAVDTAGNEVSAQYAVANIDKIAPDAPILSVTPLNRTNRTVTVTAKFASDVVKKEYSLDGQNWQAYTKAVEVTANTTIQVRGYDEAGNVSGAEYKIANIVPLDAKGPGAVILVPKVSKYNVTVKWTRPATQDKAKITGYEVEYNGKISIVKGTSLSLKNVAVSTGNTVQVRAIDSLGRYGALSSVAAFDVKDVTAPTLGKITAAIDDYTGTIAWSGSDNVGIVKYVVTCAGQSQTVTSGTSVKFDNLAIGKYKATVQAFDAAGNASKVGAVSITVKDVTPPEKVTGLAIPLADAKYNALLSWAPGVDNSGKVSRYEIKLDNGKILKSSKNSLKVSKLSVGTHTYQVRAIDKDKNIGSWSDVQTFTVRDMTAPASVKAKATVDGYSVSFVLSGKDNSGRIAKYVVTCGDKSVTTTSATAVLHDFGVGKQTALVVAYDAEGNASKAAKVSFTVKDATPPEKVTGLAIPLADAKYNALLSWAPGVDNSGKVSGYEIKLDNGKILKSSKNSLKVSKLSVGTHTYQVRAIDKDKNIGLWSDVQTFIVKDMTAPAAVSAKAKVEENSLFLTWKTPKDNVGVAGYILKHGVNLEKTETLTASQLSFRIDGIAKGNYQYQIVAVDAAGNQSKVKSGKATIKTELPMTAMNLELPDAIPSLVFDAGASTENVNSGLRYDDPLAFCSVLQTENELRLTAADLFASDSEKKSPALLAAGL